ncbi:hypothetical protein LCGC14_2859690 [marine sediment metagenome]|uniref:Uncharacterized protein n=1 Tax=marine sediment metagenome TaxID=412755 RepID=A0A0F8Y5W5_9ZZZZ
MEITLIVGTISIAATLIVIAYKLDRIVDKLEKIGNIAEVNYLSTVYNIKDE